jgi:hypothetical protein
MNVSTQTVNERIIWCKHGDWRRRIIACMMQLRAESANAFRRTLDSNYCPTVRRGAWSRGPWSDKEVVKWWSDDGLKCYIYCY